MATADVIIVLVVVMSALIGLWRGLVKEVVSLVVWLAAFVLGLAFAELAADRLVGVGLDPSLRVVVGFIIVFAAVLIVGAVVQWLLSKVIRSTGLSGMDRLLGVVFGSVRGAIVVIVALIALRPFVETEPWWHASKLRPELMRFEEDVFHLLHYASDSIAELGDDLGASSNPPEEQD